MAIGARRGWEKGLQKTRRSQYLAEKAFLRKALQKNTKEQNYLAKNLKKASCLTLKRSLYERSAQVQNAHFGAFCTPRQQNVDGSSEVR